MSAKKTGLKTAVKFAGIVLVLGGLAGCGDDGGDGGSSASDDATKDGFCKKFNGLYDNLLGASADDTSKAIAGVKEWADEMEDYGTPSEMSAQARKGFEVVVDTIQDLDEDAKLEDFQNLDDELSAADNKAAEAFGAWTTKECPAPDLQGLPSDSAS